MAHAHEDAEELLGGRSHSNNAAKRGRRAAILVAAAVAAVTIVVLMSTHTTHPLQIAAPHAIEMNEFHQTDFGRVPHILHVSGFAACDNGKNEAFNGKYTFQGKTGDGRAYYTRGHLLLYYDRECDGDKGGRDDTFGAWIFTIDQQHLFHPTRKEQLYDNLCQGTAFLMMSEHPGQHSEKYSWEDFSHRPGAVPPNAHKWKVYCGDDEGWSYQTLYVHSNVPVLGAWHYVHSSNVPVLGAWHFVKTAMPKEKIMLKHGKSRTTSEGGEWEVSGSTSVTLGGQVGFLQFFKATSEGSREVGDRLRHMWETEVQSSSEMTVTFELPEQNGSALWQWVLVAKGQQTGTVKTEQYAFTASGTDEDRPKCFPGGSKDGYRYQECHEGWEIP